MLGTEWWQGSQPTRRMGRLMGLPKRGPQHYCALGSMDESWMLACKGPSCTTGVLTVGRVESRRCPILCPNLKGLKIKYSMWKPDPRDSFLETRAPWKLSPSCALTQCAVDRRGYAQLASSLKAMPSLMPAAKCLSQAQPSAGCCLSSSQTGSKLRLHLWGTGMTND